MSTDGYRDLEVWKKAMKMVKNTYILTRRFPKEELYSLTNQIRRAAVSIPSNIAEGRSRHSTKDYMRFVTTARGSVAELETQLLISQDLAYATPEEIQPLLESIGEIGRMLSGLVSTLEKKLSASSSNP